MAGLIMTYLRRRAGIVLTPHQFRHLSAKVVLDADPGNTKPSNRFSGIGASRPRSAHMRASTAAGQRVGISISSSKPLPLKCRRGDQTGAIVSRSIRKQEDR